MEFPVVGTKVRVKFPVMGNAIGAVGYVYEEYSAGGVVQGVSIIFENGTYDGFSETDYSLCLEELHVDPRYSAYEFVNVGRVHNDYRRGYWKFHE